MATPIHAFLRLTDLGSPFMSTTASIAAASFATQLAFGAHGVRNATDKFVDLSAGLTFLLALTLSLFGPVLRGHRDSEFYAGRRCHGLVTSAHAAVVTGGGPIDRSRNGLQHPASSMAWNWRQVSLTACVALWATRLTIYLFGRMLRNGHDSRLDMTKHNKRRFSALWAIQALWVSVSVLPIAAVNAVPGHVLDRALPAPTLADVLGMGLFALGWLVEARADWEKACWHVERDRKVHDEKFITRGLWGVCRYPNYLGEITLWLGIAVASAGVLVRSPVQVALGWGPEHALGDAMEHGIAGLVTFLWDTALGYVFALAVSFVSPAFVTLALLRVTGVPISQAKYDRLYGQSKAYRKWRDGTPMLMPKLPELLGGSSNT